MGEMHENPEHVKLLERWMKSYRPEELFDAEGTAASGARGTCAEGHVPNER